MEPRLYSFLFGSVRQIKLAIRQFCCSVWVYSPYSIVSYRIVSYRGKTVCCSLHFV